MSPLPYNNPVAEPSQFDVLMALKREVLLGMNCHAVATVQSFDPGSAVKAPTVTCTINYTKVFNVPKSDGTFENKEVKYPVLARCPIIIMNGGGYSMTFPIKKGDDCMLLFNDRDISNWIASGKEGPLATGRLHSITDAVALVGLFPDTKGFTSYDQARTIISNGIQTLGLGPNGILISATPAVAGAYPLSFGVILHTFLQALTGSTDPVVVAAANAAILSLFVTQKVLE